MWVRMMLRHKRLVSRVNRPSCHGYKQHPSTQSDSRSHDYSKSNSNIKIPNQTHESNTMNPKTSPSVTSSIIISALLLFAFFEFGVCRVDKDTMMLGGIRDIPENGVEIENLARFAVEEHNKKENSLLKFARLVKAKEQVVAGMMYYLTLEANEAGKTKVYEAKVWVKPWMNFKQVQEFKVSDDQTLV